MTNNKLKVPSTRGISLKNVSHVKNVCRKIIARMFNEGSEIENSSKIAQILNVWLRAHELEQVDDLEKRVSVLEEAKR